MKQQVIHIAPVQTAKVFAVLYFVISLPFVAVMALMTSFSPMPRGSMAMLILFPVLYLVLGFVFTLLGSWIYNLVAKFVGGVEYTTAPVAED